MNDDLFKKIITHNAPPSILIWTLFNAGCGLFLSGTAAAEAEATELLRILHRHLWENMF